MEKLRRLRTSILGIPYREIVENGIRLTLAIAVNFYLSQFIFSRNLLPLLDNMFKASPLRHWHAFRSDVDRLPKMQRLWPPYPQIEFASSFTITLYIFLKCFLRPDDCRGWLRSTTSSADDEVGAGLPRRPLATRLLGAVVIAVCLFTLSLPMQRLAELHVFVIVINFIHIVLVCLSTTFFTFFYSERCRKNVKDE